LHSIEAIADCVAANAISEKFSLKIFQISARFYPRDERDGMEGGGGEGARDYM
jgi:hypothetical protein